VILIDAQAVSKQFLLTHNASVELKVRFLGLFHRGHRQSVEEFWALKNVSLRIDRGEAVGLVGRNGSGKSTLLKLIAAIYRPTSGRVLVARGTRISSMIELGVGFHPELTGRENVFLNAAIQGLTGPETEAIYGAIVEYSGLAHFIDTPIKNYSSGMYMRLGFAIAANLEPDVLLLDEIFAVGDADFQQQCVATLRGFMERGKTIIFVSHSPEAVRTMCRRTCVLDQGELAFDGDVEGGLAFYESLLAHGGALGAPVPTSVEPALTEGESSDMPEAQVESDQGQEFTDWMFEFLIDQGLERVHRVLHLQGGGSAPPNSRRRFLGEHSYVRLADCAALYERSMEHETYDVAVAESLFASLPLNGVARCIASIVRSLNPSGRFYATWFENPDPASFEPVVRANGLVTYPDRAPYHYPFGLIQSVCSALGATVERVSDSGHPTGESVLVILRG
jgi:ABC-type polysaccharide/polyol phosphate transport system ATPase subunit